MTALSNFVHLARPLGATAPASTTSINPVSVTLTPSALFSILDHSMRRPPGSPRVIGTLLGSRSDDGTVINIASCYAVPHTETAEQVEVDMDYQKAMLSLHLRANPKETLVGWYATSRELNTFSALIQNFYGMPGEGTGPAPAVHLTVAATDIEASATATDAASVAKSSTTPEVRAYISAPIGVTPERTADSCLFIPVPCTILAATAGISSGTGTGDAAERSALSTIALAAQNADNRSTGVETDLDALERAVEYVLELIERVSGYVSGVLDEEVEEPSTALGQYMLNALSLAPGTGKADIEKDFNAHIQDVLAISYLANTIRTQIDLSNRLATAALTGGAAGGPGGVGEDGEGGAEGSGGPGGRGGRGDRRGGGGRGGRGGGGDRGDRRRQRGDRGGERGERGDRTEREPTSAVEAAPSVAVSE